MKRNNSILVGAILFGAIALLKVAGSEGVSLNESARDKEILRALLPKDAECPGWQAVSSPKFFEPRNLWEHINGQAEMYLDYGFRLLLTTEYTSTDGSSAVTIEIFQMQSPDHAFGIYAAERSPDDIPVKMEALGYLGENVLNFCKGPYYVKLASFQTSAERKKALMVLAGVIATKIKGTYSEPGLFACFPEKDRVKMSERFIPKNFLGQPFLKDGYQVEYKNGVRGYQVFLVKNDSREKAGEALGKYQGFLRSQNEKVTLSRKDDYQLIFTESKKGKAIFQYGSFVGGVLGSRDLPEAERIIEEIVRKLRNRCPL
ncbi:MAG: DUF6599 family protein [Pseudomonadota bacterium]